MTGAGAGRVVLLVAGLATIGCDHVTKHAATTMLAGRPSQSYLGDIVRLAYAENTGGFLSLGASLPAPTRIAVFTIGTGLVLLVLAVLMFRRQVELGQFPRSSALGLTLFLAGGASNWLDRALRGSVVDFLNVGVGTVRTGIFNIADMAIMAGALLLLMNEVRHLLERQPAPRSY
jgi:signal peptidase II